MLRYSRPFPRCLQTLILFIMLLFVFSLPAFPLVETWPLCALSKFRSSFKTWPTDPLACMQKHGLEAMMASRWGHECSAELYNTSSCWLKAEELNLSCRFGHYLLQVMMSFNRWMKWEMSKPCRITSVYWVLNRLLQEGKWMWSDGARFTFRNWRRGEPNNKWGGEHCMSVNYNGTYHSKQVRCSLKLHIYDIPNTSVQLPTGVSVNDEACSTKNSYICGRDLIWTMRTLPTDLCSVQDVITTGKSGLNKITSNVCLKCRLKL